MTMRYIRVYLGTTTDVPAITLYEIDADGWVHRQVETAVNGSRFAPEDILMLSPVDVDGMASHPAAEEIEPAAFESMWEDLHSSRPFHTGVPDVAAPWNGLLAMHGTHTRLRWLPTGREYPGWARVPGFRHLFVQSDEDHARRICRQLFLGHPIVWLPL